MTGAPEPHRAPRSTSPLLIDGLAAPLVRRCDWGAEDPIGWPPELAPLRAVVIHHTATVNDDPDPLAMVRRIQHFHAHVRGWGDIGYSFIVLEDGRIVEGRAGSAEAPAPLAVVGGHAYGHNVGTIGIAVAGRYHDRVPTAAARDSVQDLVARMVRASGIDPAGGPVALENGAQLPDVISAHRDACDTTCPGDALVAMLEDLRQSLVASLPRPSPGSLGSGSVRGDDGSGRGRARVGAP